MAESRTRSASRVDRAGRARQLRRFHQHLQNQTPHGNGEEGDHGDYEPALLKQFTPDVLTQLDALIDGGDWKRRDEDEKEWEENWLKRSKSLITQLQHVQRWYEEKLDEAFPEPAVAKPIERADRDDDAAGPNSAAENSPEPNLPPAISPSENPEPSQPSLVQHPSGPPSSRPGDPLPSSQGRPPVVSETASVFAPATPPDFSKRIPGAFGYRPPQGEEPPATSSNQAQPRPGAYETETADDEELDMAKMRKEMERLGPIYLGLEPEFIASLDAYKTTSVSGRILSENRARHKAAQDETRAKGKDMEQCKVEAQTAKRMALFGMSTAVERDEQIRSLLCDKRDKARKAWQDSREEYFEAVDKEKEAYEDLVSALERFKIAEDVEEEALRRWNEARANGTRRANGS